MPGKAAQLSQSMNNIKVLLQQQKNILELLIVYRS